MKPKKTLQERERELQALLASSEGRKVLENLASTYEAASGRPMSCKASVITYLLVHEREQGLLHG